MMDIPSRKCPLCDSSNNTVFMKENAYNNRDHVQLVKCTECGFVYSETASIDYSDFWKSASQLTSEELDKKSVSQCIHKLVNEICKKTGVKQGKVLDFGCGAGLILRGFKEKAYDVLGIEDSAAFRDLLERNDIPTVASLSEIEDIRGSFDIVVVKDVVEHLENPLEILNEIISFIKPGGFLYIRVPNRYAYPFHWAVDTKGHVNHFTPAALKNVLKKSGLEFHCSVKVYDISSRAGKLYDSIFWKLRYFLPMTHQISLLYKK